MTTQPDILQEEIARRTAQGWVLVSRGAAEAQMRKPKRFSFVWAFLWFLAFGIGLLVYLFWHWAKSDQLIYLRAVDGDVVVTGTSSLWGNLLLPFTAYWRWAGQRQTTPGKALAYGGPVAAVVVLIIIISAASASGGGGDGDSEQVAGQPTETAPAESGEANTAEPTLPPEPTEVPQPTETPEPQIERIVQAAAGAVAEAEDVRVTLNQITDPWISDNQFVQPAAGKRYVAFDVTIENAGSSGTHSANLFNFKLSDAEDFAYEASFFGPEPSLTLTDLGSGQKTRGWIGFEVNANTPLSVLKYDPQIFSTSDIEFLFQ
jgi:hypothetical protein